MWIFNRDTLAGMGYIVTKPDLKIGSEYSNVSLYNGWNLSDCKNKKGEDFTLFSFDISTQNHLLNNKAVNSLRRLKTLRHPNILTYIDSHEGPKNLLIVSEWILPLSTYLREKSDLGNFTFMTSWGIFQITRALIFLNDDCKITHGNISIDSVFVNKSGEWKLGGFSHTKGINESDQSNSRDNPHFPPDGHLVDSWGMGCLIWEVYHSGKTLNEVTNLRDIGPLPSQLIKPYQGLVHPSKNLRITLNAFQTKCLALPNSTEGYFSNFYIDTLLFLEEVHIKSAEEKKNFFLELATKVHNFPDDIAKYKILPHLKNAFQYGGAGVDVLIPLIKLSKLCEQLEFEQAVLPCLVKMFSSPDRQTRVKLLEKLPEFADHLPIKAINEQIFPSICTGFLDNHPLVREASVRAMPCIGPRLNDKILNETLINHLIHLQTKDEQGGIRANCVVCLAMLNSHFSKEVRQGVVLTAFMKSLRDPFPPSRQSALSAFMSSLQYFTVKDMATKVMPCCSLLTIDTEKDVRDLAIKLCERILDKLKESSENPDQLVSESRNSNENEVKNSMSWTNWAVSTLTSKLRQPTEQLKSESLPQNVQNSDKSVPIKVENPTKIKAKTTTIDKMDKVCTKSTKLKLGSKIVSKNNACNVIDLDPDLICDTNKIMLNEKSDESSNKGDESANFDNLNAADSMQSNWDDWNADNFSDERLSKPNKTHSKKSEKNPNKGDESANFDQYDVAESKQSNWDDWNADNFFDEMLSKPNKNQSKKSTVNKIEEKNVSNSNHNSNRVSKHKNKQEDDPPISNSSSDWGAW